MSATLAWSAAVGGAGALRRGGGRDNGAAARPPTGAGGAGVVGRRRGIDAAAGVQHRRGSDARGGAGRHASDVSASSWGMRRRRARSDPPPRAIADNSAHTMGNSSVVPFHRARRGDGGQAFLSEAVAEPDYVVPQARPRTRSIRSLILCRLAPLTAIFGNANLADSIRRSS